MRTQKALARCSSDNEPAASKKYVALEHATTPAMEAASAKGLEAGLKAGKFIEHFALSACYRIRAKNMSIVEPTLLH